MPTRALWLLIARVCRLMAGLDATTYRDLRRGLLQVVRADSAPQSQAGWNMIAGAIERRYGRVAEATQPGTQG